MPDLGLLLAHSQAAADQLAVVADSLEAQGYAHPAAVFRQRSAEHREQDVTFVALGANGTHSTAPLHIDADIRSLFEAALVQARQHVHLLHSFTGTPATADWLIQEENFVDYLEAQLSQMRELGHEAYRASQ